MFFFILLIADAYYNLPSNNIPKHHQIIDHQTSSHYPEGKCNRLIQIAAAECAAVAAGRANPKSFCGNVMHIDLG